MDKLSKECQDILNDPKFQDKVSIFCGHWKISTCKEEPKSLFVFGDNDIKKGAGGQAIIRYCDNSIGIPTKKFPDWKTRSFYTDEEYDANCQKILTAIENVIKEARNYDDLVFPEDGFGTGLAKLPDKAPKTLGFIDHMILELFGIDYPEIRSDGGVRCVLTNDI